MRILLFFFVFVFAFSFHTYAQSYRFTVKFKYKRAEGYSLAQPSAFLSQKAIERRRKQRLVIDSTDLPINPAYISSIKDLEGVTILSRSKWLNELVIEATSEQAINTINAFPFVVHTKAVASGNAKRRSHLASHSTPQKNFSVFGNQHVTTDSINYGNNYPQVQIHEGEFLHNLGFRGQGVVIAVLDAGFFKYKTNPAFDSVRMNNRVLGEYDFVKDETSVDEDNVHGANCFSILSANRPGRIVGTAPNASYWLFRTEDAGSEKPIEEHNWIEAAEWADSAGADMISSSVGYAAFDDPAYSYSYVERDGNTALITIAADMAVKKGMIVMNSAGNSGNASDESKFVMCPADGDSVLSVGAVNASGAIAGFSSWGPNAAGKLKPNIVSVGWGSVYANTSGDPVTGNGTSYSNPNIAGLVACLWQAFSDFTNAEIIDAVQRSADRFNNPDNRYGYGIPNFRTAYNILFAKREERTNNILNGKWISVFPVPFKQVFTVFLKAPSSGNASLRLIDLNGRIISEKNIDVLQGSYYNIQMFPSSTTRFGTYFLQYSDGRNNSVIRLISL